MAITANEMNNIRDLLEDVITRRIDPRFEQMEARFDARFEGIEARLDGIDGRLDRIEEDVAVIKDVVKDHSYEIAKLKHKTA